LSSCAVTVAGSARAIAARAAWMKYLISPPFSSAR
jgi:hypothetical protein